PGPVAQTLYADAALARDFKLGPIVTVVDAADPAARGMSPEIARGQIAAADLVVLSKVDRAASTAEAEAEVHALNPGVRCIAAQYGEVDPRAILELNTSNRTTFRPAAHSGAIRSFVLPFDAPVPRALLEHFIATLVELRGADLLRVKGVVALQEGGSVLVQGVRHVFDRLRPLERGEPGLVFVTHRVEKAEIEALWRAMARLFGVH
ncbi:MAG TPA: GTP-binding protein, partial [Burkholderiales bacterium]|nr:GTP-binding protein [Burkholderiales bacterium]